MKKQSSADVSAYNLLVHEEFLSNLSSREEGELWSLVECPDLEL